jgi:hypothetical protein
MLATGFLMHDLKIVDEISRSAEIRNILLKHGNEMEEEI